MHHGELTTSLVPSPVEYSSLTATTDGATAGMPLLIWLHGGGGSRRFLESCKSQFVACWADRSLPAMAVATPSAGWSSYLDRLDGSEQWETFLLDEFIPAAREQTQADGPLLIGGISVGALGALRLAFKYPDRFRAVVAIEPTVEAALSWDRVPLRDRIHLPEGSRNRIFGEPLDENYWRANHPTTLAVANSTAIAASDLAIYLEAGDDDLLHVQHGVELLHRCLFDIGLPHEFRLTRGGNHVGPSVGPRLVDAFRYIGRLLWRVYDDASIDAVVELESFSAQVRTLEDQVGYRRLVEVEGPQGPIQVQATGQGPPVVLLPSLGRGADDFADLADRLAEAGYLALAPEPRGWRGTSAGLGHLSLCHLADDVAAVVRQLADEPATIVGHDFGGQVARVVAHRHPSLVRTLVLLATPGPVAPRAEPGTAHRRTFVPELSTEEHLEAVALAFFAPGNDPVVWVDGWNRQLATAQRAMIDRMPDDSWTEAGGVDVLVVRPSADCIVPAESAAGLVDQLSGRAAVVEVPNAGHALLPEQPRAVAVTVLTWLRRHG